MVSVVVFFKQKTAYEMRISDWSSDVCSSDLIFGDGVNFLYRKTFAQGLRGNEQAIRRWAGKFGKDVIPGSADQVFDSVKSCKARFQSSQRLLHRLMYVAANRHYLSNRFHCGGEQRLGSLELFEATARELCDHLFRSSERWVGKEWSVGVDVV